MLGEKIKIGIIYGGKSVEHDIAILSAIQVYHALDKEKYDVKMIYITKRNDIIVGKNLHEIDTYKNNSFDKCKMVTFIKKENKLYYYDLKKRKIIDYIEVFVPVLHGAGVEDGTISGYLEFLNIPYTSAGIASSAIFQDKILTKYILNAFNIPALPYIELQKNSYNHNHLVKLLEKFDFPVIIKPYNLGSSIGIKVAHNLQEVETSIQDAFKYTNKIIIEKALTQFREFNQAIFKEINNYEVSEIEEVSSNNEMLTFKDKYENQTLDNSSSRIIPAQISEDLKDIITKYTKQIYKLNSLKGVIRIDYLYDIKEQQLYINEINTIPGSYAYYLFEINNLAFSELLNKLIKNALYEYKQNNKYLTNFNSNIFFNKTLKLKK